MSTSTAMAAIAGSQASIAANEIGFFEGNAIKYLTRWRDKGGVEDLRKARHYIDKLIEIEVMRG